MNLNDPQMLYENSDCIARTPKTFREHDCIARTPKTLREQHVRDEISLLGDGTV